MKIYRCNNCKVRIILKEEEQPTNCYICGSCYINIYKNNKLTPENFKKLNLEEINKINPRGGIKMVNNEISEKKKKYEFTLTCSECGAVKKAGKKRYEKWKDTKYICRNCRKELNEHKE